MTTRPIGVYGAGGWIGAAVSRRVTEVCPVRGFARSGQAGTIRVPSQPEPDRLAEQLIGLRAIIITAGVSHLPEDHTTADAYANAVLPKTVVQAARLAGVPRVILLSSIKAVSEQSVNGTIDDQTTPRPTTPYGRSKRQGELAALAAARDHIELCVVRTPLVIGGMAPGNFGRILSTVQRGLPIPLPYPYASRSVTVRSNLVDLLVHLARSQSTLAAQVSTAERAVLTTAQLVDAVAQIMRSRSFVIPVPRPLATSVLRLLGRERDLSALTADLVVRPSDPEVTAGWQRPMDLFTALRSELAPPPH